MRGRGAGAVVVLAGVNDLAAGTSAATIFSNLQTIYDQARADGMQVVPITVLPWSGSGSWTAGKQTETTNLNTSILAYCATNGLVCIDAYNSALRTGTALTGIYDSGDGLHPNLAGSSVLANLVKAAFP